MKRLKCTDPKVGRLIAGYELGALDESRRRAFVEHAFNCPHCNEELFAMAPYMRTLRDEARHIRAQTEPVPATWHPRRLAWIGACVALFIGLSIGSYLCLSHFRASRVATLSESEVPKAEYSPGPQLVLRGPGGAFEAAMVAYQQNDFEGAARGLEALIRLEPENTEARFYHGVSLLMLGRADEAISVLKDAADRAATTSLGEACHYYLALAYARTGRPASASAEVKLVIEMDGKYRRSAEALKRRLELQR